MKSIAMALLAGAFVISGVGCNGLHKLCAGGNCDSACSDGACAVSDCGCPAGDCSCGAGHGHGLAHGGGAADCGCGGHHGTAGHGLLGHGGRNNGPFAGPHGPPTGQVTYPYYTTRGPRDFLVDNPPSIGN